MLLDLPEFSLVVLVGPSGAGKSTFARQHFLATEVLSSDTFRAMIADDENAQDVTEDAFAVLHAALAARLKHRRMVVVDATNVQAFARKPLVALAHQYHALPVAIVFDMPERVCIDRNAAREGRTFGPHVVRQHRNDLRRSLGGLQREGFRKVFVLRSEDDVAASAVERVPLWTNRRHDAGPFDLVGDVHGCADELRMLLDRLGYAESDGAYRHPERRRAVFVGDLMDRGPKNLEVYAIVRAMVDAETAFAVAGNHDVKLHKHLRGKKVTVSHGMDKTLAELAALPAEVRGPFERDLRAFLDARLSHYVFDDGRLVVAHAGIKEELQGRASRAVREFCLYGETTGETDEFGLPVRFDWARDYRGAARVVYGHTPVESVAWVNRTLCLDTGCVFGGRLTALRYPEMEILDVPALATYAESVRPLAPRLAPSAEPDDGTLRLSDVQGKRGVDTRLRGRVTIREENAAAALETMSRFAADPRWLVYLPPTMSPVETSRRVDTLEHPDEAFAYYRAQGVAEVVCEEKHMGSRAVLVVGQDVAATERRFGVAQQGTVVSRTGRPFFDDAALEAAFVRRIADAATKAGLWDELGTDWVLLDAELMPWSAKAQSLLRQQYAATAAAARTGLGAALSALEAGVARGMDVSDLLARTQARADNAVRYADAYRRYCWPVRALDDLRLAPFHLLASEGKTHLDQTHVWHMDTLAKLAATGDPLLVATPYRRVRVDDADALAAAAMWWEELTARGGEGMVVKPLEFICRSEHGLVQPAVKVRGREYLRIIYGPDYDLTEHLSRLRQRGLSGKRSLALREFALGVEALERFTQGDSLSRVHEAVFGVLALESEPVDPRL